MLEDKIFSKVFMWMFVGLAITFGIGYYVSLNSNMLYNVFKTYYIFILIAEIGIVIWLSARIHKMNPTTAKILFCVYSLLTGLTFSSIFVVYKLTSIIFVFGITAGLFLIFSLIGYYTNLDLTKLGTYLLMLLIGIIICGIINMFVKSETFNFVLVIIGLIIFIVYFAYDIQVIKKRLFYIENEENLAIYGAFQLYLDFLNVFIRLLQLFGSRRD